MMFRAVLPVALLVYFTGAAFTLMGMNRLGSIGSLSLVLGSLTI